MDDKTPPAESNIVYLGIDVAHGDKLPEALTQLSQFHGTKMRAVFCDIRHTVNQTPFAMALRADMQQYIEATWPEIKDKKKDIYIRLNIFGANTFKARDKMYEILNRSFERGALKKIDFKDPDGRKQDLDG